LHLTHQRVIQMRNLLWIANV